MQSRKKVSVESTKRLVNLIIRNTLNVIFSININKIKYKNMNELLIIIFKFISDTRSSLSLFYYIFYIFLKI